MDQQDFQTQGAQQPIQFTLAQQHQQNYQQQQHHQQRPQPPPYNHFGRPIQVLAHLQQLAAMQDYPQQPVVSCMVSQQPQFGLSPRTEANPQMSQPAAVQPQNPAQSNPQMPQLATFRPQLFVQANSQSPQSALVRPQFSVQANPQSSQTAAARPQVTVQTNHRLPQPTAIRPQFSVQANLQSPQTAAVRPQVTVQTNHRLPQPTAIRPQVNVQTNRLAPQLAAFRSQAVPEKNQSSQPPASQVPVQTNSQLRQTAAVPRTIVQSNLQLVKSDAVQSQISVQTNPHPLQSAEVRPQIFAQPNHQLMQSYAIRSQFPIQTNPQMLQTAVGPRNIIQANLQSPQSDAVQSQISVQANFQPLQSVEVRPQIFVQANPQQPQPATVESQYIYLNQPPQQFQQTPIIGQLISIPQMQPQYGMPPQSQMIYTNQYFPLPQVERRNILVDKTTQTDFPNFITQFSPDETSKSSHSLEYVMISQGKIKSFVDHIPESSPSVSLPSASSSDNVPESSLDHDKLNISDGENVTTKFSSDETLESSRLSKNAVIAPFQTKFPSDDVPESSPTEKWNVVHCSNLSSTSSSSDNVSESSFDCEELNVAVGQNVTTEFSSDETLESSHRVAQIKTKSFSDNIPKSSSCEKSNYAHCSNLPSTSSSDNVPESSPYLPERVVIEKLDVPVRPELETKSSSDDIPKSSQRPLKHVIDNMVIEESSVPFKTIWDMSPVSLRNKPVDEWSINELCYFIEQVPELTSLTSQFKDQEIDGEVLNLASNDYLLAHMAVSKSTLDNLRTRIKYYIANQQT